MSTNMASTELCSEDCFATSLERYSALKNLTHLLHTECGVQPAQKRCFKFSKQSEDDTLMTNQTTADARISHRNEQNSTAHGWTADRTGCCAIKSHLISTLYQVGEHGSDLRGSRWLPLYAYRHWNAVKKWSEKFVIRGHFRFILPRASAPASCVCYSGLLRSVRQCLVHFLVSS